MKNLYIPLSEGVAEKLRELARRELRDPKDQAAWLVLDGLRRAGLEPEPPKKLVVAPAGEGDR